VLIICRALGPVLRHDAATALFVLPHLVANVVGESQGAEEVLAEILAVLKGRGDASREEALCVQAVFGLLDELKSHCGRKPVQAGSTVTVTATDGGTSVAGDADGPAERVVALLDRISREALAAAAARSGAHARALLYVETSVRERCGGGHNPAALRSAKLDDEDVSALVVRFFFFGIL
jgi:hypothetical protein